MAAAIVAPLTALTAALHRHRRKVATAAVVSLACFLLVHAVLGTNGIFVYSHKRSQYKKLQQEMDALHQDNERLQHNIQALKTDPKAIEKEAREQLKYARPGEVVYTLPPAATPQPATATAQNR